MHSWFQLGPGVLGWLGAFFGAVALALIPLVVLRRKEPSSTIAWILTLLFLPALGALLFLLFGRDRVRWPARRKRQADALVQGDVAARTDQAAHGSPPRSGELTELEGQIFHVGALLTGGSPSTGNQVDVLTVGQAVYDALGDAIDRAKH